jgi:hypothetical protein
MTWTEFLPGWNGHYTYDEECLPNFFSCRITRVEDNAKWTFEISDWAHQGKDLCLFVHQIAASGGRMVGFNNEWYDYPILHLIMTYNGNINNAILYNKSQAILAAGNGPQKDFSHFIWGDQRYVPQVDLFKIHHFDNKAKSTSLKLLEFNMRLSVIDELELDWNKPVTYEESRRILEYNGNDVDATVQFLHYSKKMISFRDELSAKYGKDFTNFNDTKIGEEIVKIELQKRGVTVNKWTQTIRDRIVVNDIIFPFIRFETKEFNQVLDYFRRSVIDPEKIKGFFKESDDDEETKFTSTTLNGFTFDFGAGGIHGSVKNRIVVPHSGKKLKDIDAASYYPNISVKHRIYPAHLGETWCDVGDFMFHERIRVGKKTAMGNAYKLGLNGGMYGKTNDKHSAFLDSQYTMTITINGQLMLCMLVEQLMKIPGFEMIQINTDGLTYVCPEEYLGHANDVAKWWEELTKLKLEDVEYSKMCIRDVNSYLAVKPAYFDDKKQKLIPPSVKRIGAYAYELASENDATRELPWHKNHSAVVVAKAAEAALIRGENIERFIRNHIKTNPLDFMLRTKANRSTTLLYGDRVIQRISRYYASTDGDYIFKLMEPTQLQINNWNTKPHWKHVTTGKTVNSDKAPSGKYIRIPPPSVEPPMRRIGVDAGQKITLANSLQGLNLDNIDISYYVKKARKLVDGLV